MNEQDIKATLLRVCKISNLDSDFNVVAFHAMCDRLKEIGATGEREACAKVVIDIAKDESSIALVLEAVADAIRARGNT